MLLNDFLNFRLGVQFEDRFNSLAAKEIIDNKDDYPLIAEIVENMSGYYYEDETDPERWDSSFFDCDDPEYCAGFDEMMELYRAFLNALMKSIRGKDFELKCVSFGRYYLIRPNSHLISDPYLKYKGMEYIDIYPEKRVFTSEVIRPFIFDNQVIGHESTKTTTESFVSDSKELLNKLKENLIFLDSKDGILCGDFPGFKGDENSVDENSYSYEFDGYGYEQYDLVIDNNHIKLFTSSSPSDPYAPVFKTPVLDALTEKEKESGVVMFL